ncbi:hypothetical protein [Schlesneria paludicola]|uniref:hypothetical protein n=1 Tax=Schlesneria paludicola TaxID=360056 RepID=UPI00029AC124|nr:hypothetical protein [Schlesneria paludicola]
MSGITTNFDVLEDSLGFPLLPENRDRIAEITFDDIKRMAEMIHDHVHADYFAMPIFEDSVGVCNPMGTLGRSLGGYSQREGTLIDGTSRSIVGNIYFSLLTNDRLALPDGLQYVLDYYRLSNVPPHHHDILMNTVRKVLTSYADLGPLFHSRHLIIVPEDIYGHYYTFANDDSRWDEHFYERLAQSSLFQDAAQRIKYTPERQEEHEREYPELDQEGYCRLLGARSVSSSSEAMGLRGALALASSEGYRPIVHGILEQAIMDALIKSRFQNANEVSAGIAITDSSVLLPHLGNLPPMEFAALKASGEAKHVARCIVGIEERAAQMIDRPIEMREMIEYELTRAAKAIDKTVKSSHVLSEFRKEVTKVGIGFMTFSAASVAIRPELLNDPLKVLVSGLAGGVGAFAGSMLQKQQDGRTSRPAAQAFIKLKDSFVNEVF